jgi:selenocysteine lyase/cysteine desulfurase
MTDRATTPESLYADPNALAGEYSRFRVAERLLLTGHSHQAWPDCGFAGHITLGANTHELVVRFLSAIPLRRRPRLVTTDGEFHSIRRQLARLGEEGIEIVRVAANPVASLAEPLVSCVLFRDARIVPGLAAVQAACERVGAEMLVDAYHALAVVPFSLAAHGLEQAFVTGGGYKYCQLGEGNCFLRVPPSSAHRPVITGWFSEFGELEGGQANEDVAYGTGPDRFAGSTYDPTSHYRAAEVFDFFERRGLTPSLLREVSRHQVGRLAARFDALDADPDTIRRPDMDLADVGGFLALSTPHAGALRAGLRARGVLTDHRDDVLRLGPAPYLSDRQLDDAVAALGEAVAELD